MDPDEALERLRLSIAIWREATKTENREDVIELGDKIAEHLNDLDEWLTRGGFVPSAWMHRSSVQIRDLTGGLWELSQLLGRFKARLTNGHTDRSEMRAYMFEISEFASAIADGIAAGAFPELQPKKKEGGSGGA